MHSRSTLFALGLGIACGTFACGGKPVGGKVPAANPAHVAGAAAAAAALVTLADPKAARQRQEQRGGDQRKQRTKKVKETVPEAVLFAPSQAEGSDADKAAAGKNDKELPPCKKPAKKEAGKTPSDSVELFPPLSEDKIKKPKKCRDTEEKDENERANTGDESGKGQ